VEAVEMARKRVMMLFVLVVDFGSGFSFRGGVLADDGWIHFAGLFVLFYGLVLFTIC
jgi:hypothetical protein